MDQDESIELVGIRTHNLKNFSIKFPLGKISVVTGVSGSGKSSLVFDTLYGEAYRRYVESLSSYARQYLKQLAKPDLDRVENLPPAIAVKQVRSGMNQRSTVGTMTELTDVLRILFGHLSRVFCCGKELVKATGPYMAQDALQNLSGQKLLFLAPLDEWGKIKAGDLKPQLEAQGFTRAYFDGQVQKISEIKAADLKKSLIVVDRITATEDNTSRMIEASELTLKLGRGRAVIRGDKAERHYNRQLACPLCAENYVEPSQTLFNHNHPQGACEKCQGFGRMPIKDRAKITPDLEASIATESVPPWNFGEHRAYYRLARKSAKARGLDSTKPFKNYTSADWKWLYEGDAGEFDGINGYFAYLDTKRYKAHYRIHAARFTSYVSCDECHGYRLNQKARACQIESQNFVDVIKYSIAELQTWFERLADSTEANSKVAAVEEAIHEGILRLTYLLKMGLGYLSLHRSARTLSGGEVQRINMARSLGSALTGTLFCLDEPSVGLHARDSQNLLSVILELRDQGNTIVIVEHERAIIRGAEYLIEIGPGAGHRGGNLVYAGDPKAYHTEEKIWPKGRPLSMKEKFLVLKDVTTHNLKGVEASFLLGGLNVVCGVSGSGKTSLIRHSLFPLLAKALGQELDEEASDNDDQQGTLGPSDAVKTLSSVHFVSQDGIGRSTRSTIATYLGFYDDIRKILATTPAAKASGMTPGFFSFNVPGGRCETCKGLGYVVEDLSFLGEMPVTCSSCRGMQFNDDALLISYRGRSLHDILKLTIDEAREFFFEDKKLARALDQIIGMGLGYVRLGQSTSSFSGGEAQRLKLLRLLLDAVDRKPCCLIFDEPSTGLSDKDVQQLLLQLLRLRDAGHTVIVVEHHLGLISAADWLLEVGPEAAAMGGSMVFQGPPAGIVKAKNSRTAPFLI